MDDGELDISSQHLMSSSDMSNSFDEFLKNTHSCTHTHTCNLPGPSTPAHTHTCYHTHTQVISSSEGKKEDHKKHKKPLGNREAVRKYREKKKAHAAFLEEEVKKLRTINNQLVKKLQRQAVLEAELVSLRRILSDFKGKIDVELGVFPFHTSCNGEGLHCNVTAQCGGGNSEIFGWDVGCMPAVDDCQINANCGEVARQ